MLCLATGAPEAPATAHLRRIRTDQARHIDLSVPIWTIEHIASAFYLSADRASEHTYNPDFPRPRAGFATHL